MSCCCALRAVSDKDRATDQDQPGDLKTEIHAKDREVDSIESSERGFERVGGGTQRNCYGEDAQRGSDVCVREEFAGNSVREREHGDGGDETDRD